MNFNYGFTATSYEVISFDDNNLPQPFPGTFFEEERGIIATASGPLLYISYGCAAKGYQDYSYFEFYKSMKELCGQYVAQTTAIEDFVSNFFTKGLPVEGYHPLMPKEHTSLQGMVEQLKESTHEFQEKYKARKEFEQNVSNAKNRLSAYQAKCDACTFAKSGGAQHVPLEQLKKNSKLGDSQIEEMKINAKGLISIHQFLNAQPKDSPKEGVVLGLNHLSTVDGFCSITGLEPYGDTYERYYGNVKENENFMTDLTAEGRPIIFLVPNDVLTHDKKGATARELEWLLEHPDKMRNVTFVFGAYDCIPENDKIFSPPYTDVGIFVSTYQDSLARRIFKQIIANDTWFPKNREIYQTFRKIIELDTKLTERLTQSFAIDIEDLDDDVDEQSLEVIILDLDDEVDSLTEKLEVCQIYPIIEEVE